jgi:hypothetical protein
MNSGSQNGSAKKIARFAPSPEIIFLREIAGSSSVN